MQEEDWDKLMRGGEVGGIASEHVIGSARHRVSLAGQKDEMGEATTPTPWMINNNCENVSTPSTPQSDADRGVGEARAVDHVDAAGD